MKVERTIETNQEYREFASLINGIEITFRQYFSDNLMLIKVDKGFAMANGYKTLEDLALVAPELCTYEWMDADCLRVVEDYHKTLMQPQVIN